MPCLYSPFFPELLRHFLGLDSRQRIYDAGTIWVIRFDETCNVLHEVLLQARFLADRVV